MIILLWSDVLLWLSVLIISVGLYSSVRNPQGRLKWLAIISRPVSVVAVIIIACYLIIALLDSIHLQAKNQPNPYSLLDVVLSTPLNANERTYSSPLAFKDFSLSYLPDGTRAYAKLTQLNTSVDTLEQHQQHLSNLNYQALKYWFWVVLVLGLFTYYLRQKPTQNAAQNSGLSSAKLTGIITISVLSFLLIWVIIMLPNYHILGTDKAGVDVFYKSIKSIRTSLIFGLVTTLISLPIAIILGLMAGYFKGWVDDVIQFFYTTINAVPSILLIAALVVIVQVYITQNADYFDNNLARADAKLVLLCLVIALTSWTGLCRLIRAETLKISQLEYVASARIFGLGHFKILWQHLLPNVMHLVLITMVLEFSALVLTESILSYIGIGVDSTTHSWGNMINSARLELAKTPIVWWSLTAAFVLMFVLVLSVNLLSDRVREVFDPRGNKDNKTAKGKVGQVVHD